MASHEYHIDEKGAEPEQPKPRMTILGKEHEAHVMKMSIGDKLSMLVSGRICEIREGYGKEKRPEATMEIDKMENMKMGSKMMDREDKDGKDS